MHDAKRVLDDQFLEMRWRCLSLAADLDRIARAQGGADVSRDDLRLRDLRAAFQLLSEPDSHDRAQRLQMIFSDRSPDPRQPEGRGKNT